MLPSPTAQDLGLISENSARKLARLPGRLLAHAEFLFARQLDDWRSTAAEIVGSEKAQSVLFELSLNPDLTTPEEIERRRRQWEDTDDESLRFFELPSVEPAAIKAHREVIDHVLMMDPDYERRYDLRAALIIEGVFATGVAAGLASDAGVVIAADVAERFYQLANNVCRYQGMTALRENNVNHFPELTRLDDLNYRPSLADAVTMAANDPANSSDPGALARIASTFATTQWWRRDMVTLVSAFEASSNRVADEFQSETARLLAEDCREMRGVIVDLVDNVDRVGRTHSLTHVLRAAYQTVDLGLGNGPKVAVPSAVAFRLQSRLIELSGMTTTALAAKTPDIVKQVAHDVMEASRTPEPRLAIEPPPL